MISDEKLLKLNKRGLIPGPYESNEQYYQRIDFCEKFFNDPGLFFKKNDDLSNRIGQKNMDWVYAKLIKTFDIAPDYFVGFYSDKDLYFFQGACTWIYEHKNKFSIGILQLRKKLEKKKYFFYDHDEILTHELAHLARMGFDEKNEEIFAYILSSSKLRAALGPIIEDEKEVLVFFSFVLISMVSLFLSLDIVYLLSSICTVGYLSLGLFRLIRKKVTIRRAAKNLGKVLKVKKSVRATLFRMSDSEIKLFSKLKPEKIIEYVNEKKEKSLRWKMIDLAYFKRG